MKFVALVSGGKDSCFNILHCLSQGHELVALANLHPEDTSRQELDSFMYQTVGHDVLDYYSECCEVPMYRQAITGGSENQRLEYSTTLNDETEDLYKLLVKVLEAHPDIKAVSVGAILSNYQRTRVEHVCLRLGLVSLAYLWQRDQLELLSEMCESGLDARLIKVAAVGLDERHLTKSIQQMLPVMINLNNRFDVHICGEGGEYETLVLDAPFFKSKKLEIVDTEIVHDSGGVCYLKLKVKIVSKTPEKQRPWSDYVKVPPLLNVLFEEIYNELPDPETQRDLTTHKAFKQISTQQVKLVKNKLFISNITSSRESLEDQVVDIFTSLKNILVENELTFEHIQASQLLVSSMADFGAINKVYGSYFSEPLPPSRICVETILPEGVFLQLSVTVLVDLQYKKGIHIQGMSYWAPCNIGPYSQSIVDTQNSVATISGQIPLIPASMELCEDVKLSTVLALQHFDCVKNIIQVKENLSTVGFVVSDALVSTVCKTWEDYSSSSLIVVKVTALPRNAQVEWGGVTYTEHDSDDDDDDDEDMPSEDSGSSLKTVNGEVFDTLFLNDYQPLFDLLEKNKNCHCILYANPETMSTRVKQIIGSISLEFVPVVEVWDKRGVRYEAGAVIRAV